MLHIYPAIMGVDEKEVQKLELLKGVSNRVHIDIMDNIFVPNITTDAQALNNWDKKTDFLIWLHLMVEFPLSFYQEFELPIGSIVSFHLESSVDIFEMAKLIKEKKQLPSLAISPKTTIEEAIPYLAVVSQVVLMSVEPGFSGQPFLESVIKKLNALVDYRKWSGLDFRIAMDGGINKSNIGLLALMGVDDFAVSSGIFSQNDPVGALYELQSLVEAELD